MVRTITIYRNKLYAGIIPAKERRFDQAGCSHGPIVDNDNRIYSLRSMKGVFGPKN